MHLIFGGGCVRTPRTHPDAPLNDDLKKTVMKIEKEISPIMTEIFEIEFSKDSKQLAVYIGGYVAKKIKKH